MGTEEKKICGILNLTVRCNQDCTFCCDGDVKDSGHDLSTGEAKQRLRGLADQGADSVTFIGGEPTVRKDLAELVAHATRLGLRTGLTTNGTLLKPARLERLLEAGLTSLEISMHAADPDRAAEISRRSWTGPRQAALLELLAGLPDGGRPGLAINCVVFSGNLDQVVPVARVAVQYKAIVDEFFINVVDPIGYPGQEVGLVPPYDEAQGPVREATQLALAAGLNVTLDNLPACRAGPVFPLIRSVREGIRGVRYAKSTLRIQDLTPENDMAQYQRINPCRACPVAVLCPGVNFRYLAVHGPRGFAPFVFPPMRQLRFAAGDERGPLADLIGRLRTDDARLRSATPVRMQVSSRCNNRCLACPHEHDRGGEEPGLVQLLGRMDKLAVQGRRVLCFDGPEPTLRADLPELLTHAAERMDKVILHTNGRMLSYPPYAHRVATAGLDEVSISFHGGSPKDHDPKVRVEGAFRQSLAGLEAMVQSAGPHVAARIHLYGDGDDDWHDLFRRFSELGVWSVRPVPAGVLPEAAWEGVEAAAAVWGLKLPTIV